MAPFTGRLLTIDLAISMGQKAFWCQEEIKLQLDLQFKQLNVDLDLEKAFRKNEHEVWETQKGLLLTKINELESVSWYERPIFVGTMSVLVTLLVIYSAATLIEVSKK